MYVLDTDTASIDQRGRGTEYDVLTARLAAADRPVRWNIVTFEEHMRGWLAYTARARTPEEYSEAAFRLHAALRYYRTRDVLDFTPAAAERFRRLKTARVRIGTPDLRIASIALSLDATVITRNLSDFRKVPDLKAEDWTRPG